MIDDKKLHERYLADIRCDVSQHSKWRALLFLNNENTPFHISAESIADVFDRLARIIGKHNLQYIVERISEEEYGITLDPEFKIVFKFYPANYPEFVKYSFINNVPGL